MIEVKMEVIFETPNNGSVDCNYTLQVLRIGSVECCGWFDVHDFPYDENEKAKLARQDIKNICSDDALWNDGIDDYDQHPLYCVLAGSQNKVFAKDLLELGWVKGVPFINPNTGNLCQPYQFVPDNYKV